MRLCVLRRVVDKADSVGIGSSNFRRLDKFWLERRVID